MLRILLIEDDAILNQTVSQYLRLKKYSVTAANDGTDAIRHIDSSDFDLYVIDINIPSVSGLDIVEYLRRKDLTSPIIMITASIELANFKKAYHNGCNDYIRKPFHLEELNIRLLKLLPDINKQQSIIAISPSASFDVDYEELTIDGGTKRLRKKERRLLSLLVKNINKTMPFEVIENYVWENKIKDIYPLRQLVNELRKQLGEGGILISVVRGVGYRLEVKNPSK